MEIPLLFRWVGLGLGALSLLAAYAAVRRFRAAEPGDTRRTDAAFNAVDCLLGAVLLAAFSFGRFGLGVWVLAVQGLIFGAQMIHDLRRRRAVAKPPVP
ncbi:hypothetical protein [Streptomyces sp. NPDC058613]|uniref:hypothetical protein n=1 Tax=Streptomyces sp. NPDC058613 TaxID=3346556 RepID=UPI0036665709